MNSCIMVGRLTADPELKYTQNGTAVAKFNLAVDRGRRDAAGNSQADFFPIIVWKEQGENCSRHLVKGQRVAVKGRVENRSYTTQDGSNRTVTEVIAEYVEYLEKPSDPASRREGAGNPASKAVDDIPF